MRIDPDTGEISDVPGTIEVPGTELPEHAEPLTEVSPDSTDSEEPSAEEEHTHAPAGAEEPRTDGAEAQPVRRDTGLDFEVTASEAAAMMTERLGKKTTTATFRRMVIDGSAPEMVDSEEDSPRWSQVTLDAWLDVLEAEAAADTVELEVSPDGKDFYLTAAEAAALFSETVGGKTTVAQFRRMVIAREAPAAALQAGGTAKWSQTTLDAWLSESLLERGAAPEAEPEHPGTEDEEPKPVHEDVYDFYVRTFSLYYELHDTTSNAMTREKPIMSWCKKWWLHRGVVGRLTAAWYAWEVAHAEGGSAISAWILEHADRHFDRIMAEDGPLRMCKSDHTDALDVFPTEPAPEPLRLKDNEKKGEQQ